MVNLIAKQTSEGRFGILAHIFAGKCLLYYEWGI
jgi:hypothetical protein